MDHPTKSHLIARYEGRLVMLEQRLRDLESLAGFRLVRRALGHGEVDVTEQAKQDLRDAIADYRQMLQHLRKS